MDPMESCVPPGFRFHPTDEELVGYYLRKKVASQKIDLDVIRDIDLYRIEPWDLQERCRIGYEVQNEWYFFSHKDKKYPTGTRTNRATMAGFWKATGRDKAVNDKTKLIGMRKTLVFYRGRAPNGQKTDWIMHEYRLETDDNGPSQEEGWVVCRAFKKRPTGQRKSVEGWDSSYFYDEPSGISSVLDPIDQYKSRHPQCLFNKNALCKQETKEVDHTLSIINLDKYYVQFPQLESPPPPPFNKRPSSRITEKKLYINEEEEKGQGCNNNNIVNKVTDWRALDKFVASQLSQEDRFDVDGASSSFREGEIINPEMPLEILQGGDVGNKFNGFLSSSLGCDIGICIFKQ